MDQQDQPVRVEAVDWPAALPFLRLFGAFRMAIHPPKLLLALLLVIVMYLFGCALDRFFGPRVYSKEINQYAVMSPDAFAGWRQQRREKFSDELWGLVSRLPLSASDGLKSNIDAPGMTEAQKVASAKAAINKYYDGERAELDKKKGLEKDEQRSRLARLELSRRDQLAKVGELERQGIFAATLAFKIDAFEHLVRAASSFDFGFQDLTSDRPSNNDTVCAALRDLMVTLPCWLWHNHCVFLAIWFFVGMAIWALLGGALCRMTAVDAARARPVPAAQAIAYAGSKWVSFYVCPLIPLILIALIWLTMSLGGMLLKVPVLEVVGAILFFLALAGGLIVALLMIGLLGGANLLYPAIAVEGTDAFDAVSRAYSYVFKRPWRLIFYSLVSLVYGAITYLFIGAVIYLALTVTHRFVGTWGLEGDMRALIPLPQFGDLNYDVDWSRLGISGKIAAGLIKLWVALLVALLGAFAISYYFSANTWIYLLLRRAEDDTEYDDVYLDTNGNGEPHAADKVEPAAPTQQ